MLLSDLALIVLPLLCTQYIYISLNEMHAVADYLRKQGRVTIHGLASKSAELIDLEPKTASVTTLHTAGGVCFDSLGLDG